MREVGGVVRNERQVVVQGGARDQKVDFWCRASPIQKGRTDLAKLSRNIVVERQHWHI